MAGRVPLKQLTPWPEGPHPAAWITTIAKITRQPFGRLAILVAPEAHLGPAGQVVGRAPLKKLALVITFKKYSIITNPNSARTATPSGLGYNNHN